MSWCPKTAAAGVGRFKPGLRVHYLKESKEAVDVAKNKAISFTQYRIRITLTHGVA